jgi:FAD/FMN-containing dehydrogenase
MNETYAIRPVFAPDFLRDTVSPVVHATATETGMTASDRSRNFVEACIEAIGAAHVLTDSHDTAPFLTDWRKRYTVRRAPCCFPAPPNKSLKWCSSRVEYRVPIVPQGGNTGHSGGRNAGRQRRTGGAQLARLNRIRDIDPHNNTITVEAGVILADIQARAEQEQRLFALSLAAEGSCTIGGNLSTNAGGTGVLRYGNTRELCLGLEVVTPQGELWDGLRGLRKDNTGYDLRDLFIGAEGTLGIITAAVMKLHPAPVARVTALAALASPHAALDFLARAALRRAAC